MNTFSDIAIRQAGESDVPALWALVSELGFRKEPGYFEHCIRERPIFIGVIDGRDSGYVTLNRQPHYHLFKRLSIPEIQDLNVAHRARRRGVAAALIRHCENFIRGEGRKQIGIGVGLYPGYGMAQRLYVKLGYVPDGNGIAYNGQTVAPCEMRPVDDDLCLMMVKDL